MSEAGLRIQLETCMNIQYISVSLVRVLICLKKSSYFNPLWISLLMVWPSVQSEKIDRKQGEYYLREYCQGLLIFWMMKK